TALMNLPGVLQPVADHGQRAEQSAEIVHDLVEQACEQLTTMRRREGKALGEELTGFGREIAERLEIIQKRAPEVVRAYHQRLQDRVQELIRDAEVDIAGPELAREVAVFAERADIREELQRLQGHLDQFHQRLDDDSAEPVGRTLEFLAQEMLREANTLGSKASDTEIGREVVTIKGVIDRIREQAANVE
ncbi:MAG: DUF1732 domain-containing protein, partial [Phycisphaeraceae bacterium]|nr:DUF1732 domain-containing protein [Phycisphaeraceae bacterium]